MKVLMVTQDFWPVPGGIQTYCYELAKALSRQGIELTVVTSGPSDPRDGNEGFQVIRYPLFHTSFLFLWSLRIARLALRRQNGRPVFDAILCAQWQSALWRLLPGANRGPRCVSMIHGRELLQSVFGRFTAPLLRCAFQRIDAVAPNSHPVLGLAQQVVGSSLPQAFIIHPGVDDQRFHPPRPGADGSYLRERFGLQGKKILLTVTRMVARKNPEVVIRALPAILEQIPDCVYVIVGGGPEKPRMKALAEASPARHAILFPGFVPDDELADWYRTCDAFILPSRQTSTDVEGFGIVYLEAGACAKPVIGTRTGGIGEAVPDGHAGILLSDPDNIEETRQAVVGILGDQQTAIAMGQFARTRIEQELTWDACARNWIEFLLGKTPA